MPDVFTSPPVIPPAAADCAGGRRLNTIVAARTGRTLIAVDAPAVKWKLMVSPFVQRPLIRRLLDRLGTSNAGIVGVNQEKAHPRNHVARYVFRAVNYMTQQAGGRNPSACFWL